MPERHSTKELFYGHPDWLIAQVCCVHIQTARHWKSGIRRPGATALRLWQLYASDRIVPDAWQGWGFRKDKLYDPEGHETDQGQLRNVAIVWQLVRELTSMNPDARGLISRLAGPPPGTARRRKPEAFMPADQFRSVTEAEREAVFGPHPNQDLRRQSAQPMPRRKSAS